MPLKSGADASCNMVQHQCYAIFAAGHEKKNQICSSHCRGLRAAAAATVEPSLGRISGKFALVRVGALYGAIVKLKTMERLFFVWQTLAATITVAR